MALQNNFNQAAQKVVNFDEIEAKEKILFQKNFTKGEKLFHVFVDIPHSILTGIISACKDIIQDIKEHSKEMRLVIERKGGDLKEMTKEELIQAADLRIEQKKKAGLLDNREEGVYTDVKTGAIYLSKTCFDEQVRSAISSGLNKKFQEKSAALSRQAFEECHDHSDKLKSGQLKPF